MRLPDYERGVVTGLFIGEASFTGDGREPAVAVKMHVRHTELLQWLAGQMPGSRLYGPYAHEGKDFMGWMARGHCLRTVVMPQLQGVWRLCPHVGARIERMEQMYPSHFMPPVAANWRPGDR